MVKSVVYHIIFHFMELFARIPKQFVKEKIAMNKMTWRVARKQ